MNKMFLAILLVLAPTVVLAESAAGVHDSKRDAAVRAMIDNLGLKQSRLPSRELPGWRRPEKIVAWVINPEQLRGLQAVAPGIKIVGAQNTKQAAAEVVDAQVVIGFCNQAIVSNAPQLHWVQTYYAGVEGCVDIPGMQDGNKLLTNGQRIASPALAEHAIAMMMALVRGLDAYHTNQLQSSWQRNVDMQSNAFFELEGRTALVVGLGGIGTQAAKRAHALGMRVVATRGSRREGPDFVDYVGLADEANKLAAEADVVINAAPLTDQTRGMFDAAFFAAMKPSAYFVSVGRGASTVTDDLVAALKSGAIAGAGLDVTDPEPLPADHPLWTIPRVIISPHTGGNSDQALTRLALLVQENLRRYIAGEKMLSVVNIKRGY